MPTACPTKFKHRQVMQLQRRSRNKPRNEYVGGDIKLTNAEVNVVKNGTDFDRQTYHCRKSDVPKAVSRSEGFNLLKSPVVGQSLSFPATQPPFVQMLHVGNNHWLTVVAVDKTTVKVFDSMFRCVGTCVSMQTALMSQSNEEHISFRIENAQSQEGGVDCGLFAIAFTTEFCFGNNPECYR